MDFIKTFNLISVDENIAGDKVEFTIKDSIDEKISANVSRGNKTLNECIEDWYSKIETDYKMYHLCRNTSGTEAIAAQDNFKKNMK